MTKNTNEKMQVIMQVFPRCGLGQKMKVTRPSNHDPTACIRTHAPPTNETPIQKEEKDKNK